MLSEKFNKRVIMLEKCIVMISAINTEIEFLLKPSSEIITYLASRKDLAELKFISDCNKNILDGADVRSAWQDSVRKEENVINLKKNDIVILSSFGEMFGSTGCEGQCANCKLYVEKLQSSLNDARQARDKYSKLFSLTGLLTGLYLIIFFL
jgi:stage III sporulation protein AB